MGAWGVGIFSNDDAADIRESFRDLIADGLSAEDATTQLMGEVLGGQSPDDHDFWLGLATAQHRLGHVAPDVIARALDIIVTPGELARWPAEQREKRQEVLSKLRDELSRPPRTPKRIRPRAKVDTRLAVGQHVVVPVGSSGKLLRVVGVREDKGGRYPHAAVVAWDGSDRQLRKAHRLETVLAPEPRREDEAMGFVLIGSPNDPDVIEVLPVVSDRKTPTRRWTRGIVAEWSELERHF